MINNKRGLSGVIVTLITVLLAIVAIGIVWVVISGVLEGNRGSIDVATMCQGAIISIDSAINTSETECAVVVKRLPGVSQEVISGFEVSVDGGTLNVSANDLATERSVAGIACEGTPAAATAKVYFTVDGEKNYCSAVGWTA